MALTGAEARQLLDFAVRLRMPPTPPTEPGILVREIPVEVEKLVEKIIHVEKPVLVERTKIVERIIDRPVEVVRTVEVPVERVVYRQTPFNPLLSPDRAEVITLTARLRGLERDAAEAAAKPPPPVVLVTRDVHRQANGLVQDVTDSDGTVTSVIRDDWDTPIAVVRRSPTIFPIRTTLIRDDFGYITKMTEAFAS